MKKFLETNENEHTIVQNIGSLEREVHSNIGLSKNHRNISNKQPNPTSTRIGGITTNKTQNK